MDTVPQTEIEGLRARVSELERQLARTNSNSSGSSNDLDLRSIGADVLDHMSEGVSVFDEDGVIRYTNRAEDAMFGYARGELISHQIEIQTASEDRANHGEVLRKLQTAGSWCGEWLSRKKDGTAFHTRAKITSLALAGKRYWLSIREDVTERRRSETEIRHVNESLNALISASPLPIIAFGRDGLIRLWNPAAERVFGWSESEVLGKPLPFIPQEKLSEHRQMRERDLQGEGFTSQQLRRVRKDGTPIDISVSTAAIREASGQVTGVMSVYMDVTEQHKAAEEQRQSIATLRVIEAQLTLLVEASSALLASPDSAHVLRTILRLAQQFISAEAYAVWRKTSDGWRLIASAGLSDGYERSIRPNDPAGSTMPGRPILIEDVETSDFVRHRLGEYRKEGIRALLAIPLHIRGEVGGTIGFYYRSSRTFDVAEQRIAEALGNLAAAALGTAELYDRQAELRSAAEAAERRSSFLASVGEVLASSLDYETTLASVAKLAVPHFADWCSVDIAEADGSLRCLALEHVDPEKIRFAADFRRRYPPSEDQMSRIVFRTGSSVLIPDISESMLAESARDPEHLRLLRTVGLKSVICAPMRIHGRTLGVITFVTSDSGRGYVSTDLAMAEEIARRAAVAVENARLFKEVSESEERFRRFYDSNMIGVAFWHVDGYITAANDAYLRVMGARREQLEDEGRIRWSSHTPVEYSSVDEQVLQECREFGASATYEKEYVRPDGTRIPVLIAAAFISGSPNDGVAFVLDITDRKRLERQFRGLADAAVQITGASSVEEVLRIASEQARSLTEASRASATLSTTTEEADLTVPLKNRSGKTIGAVRVFKESPGEIADSDRAILIQLAEMASIAIENVTLNHFLLQSNEDLRRANEDLNQFAYSASHDLQEPLRMISIYTQLLSRRFGSELDAEAHKFMRYTLDGAQRMEILLRDLLAYTQAVNIRGLPERPVASRQALDRALANLQPLISSSQATINIGDLPPVRAFEVHLVQLFQNLIGNALKYRSAEPPRIDVDARRASPESMWLFRVRDNGMGIDARYHSQIFGLFKRLHSAAEYPGTGIGLAICQKILERYGGTIWVESNQGKGSTFHFTLPV